MDEYGLFLIAKNRSYLLIGDGLVFISDEYEEALRKENVILKYQYRKFEMDEEC